MGVPVLLPKVGLTMEEGTIDEWLVEPGTFVAVGQPLLRMATDKVDVEVEAEAEGIVRLVAAVGQTLPPGTLIAWLLAAGEEEPQDGRAEGAATRLAASPNARRIAAEHAVDLSTIRGTGPNGRVVSEDVEEALAAASVTHRTDEPVAPSRVTSPLIRRLARDLNVDLTSVRGSGPGGTVTRRDVVGTPARTSSGIEATTSKVIPLTGMRGAIARNMTASLQEMAQLTHGYEADVTALVALRNDMKVQLAGVEYRVPTITDFIARAAVLALAEHPGLNASVRSDGIHLLEQVHLGIAVALPDGLVVPVVRNADTLSIDELGMQIRDLADRAQASRLSPDDLVGGTFAVTSLGTYGVDFFTPVINPGNVGILGVGRVRAGTRWEADVPHRSDVITLSLTFDHRAVDGAPAAEFLRSVCDWLARPLALLAG